MASKSQSLEAIGKNAHLAAKLANGNAKVNATSNGNGSTPIAPAPRRKSVVDSLADKLAAASTSDGPEWNGDVRQTLADGILDRIAAVLKNKKASAAQKDAALAELTSLAPAHNADAKALLPWLLPLLPVLLDLYAERTKTTADLANKATNAVMRLPGVWAYYPIIFPLLLEVAKSSGTKKETRVAALKHLGALVKRGAGRQVAEHLERVIEGIEPCLHDIAEEVSKTAMKTLTDLCAVISNADIVPHVPLLVQTMARPNEVAACLDKISRTTFVATVDGPSLAIMVPLLLRALQERSASLLRPTVIIIDNLSKLVVDPAVGKKFLPLLEPGVVKIVETAAFPEIRALAEAARKSIRSVLDKTQLPGGVVDPRISNLFFPFASLPRIVEQVISVVEERLAKAKAAAAPAPAAAAAAAVTNGDAEPEAAAVEGGEDQAAAAPAAATNGHHETLVDQPIIDVISSVVAPSLLELMNFQEYDQTEWTPCIAPFLKPLLPGSSSELAEAIADDVFNYYDTEYQKIAGPRAESPVDPNEVPLCDITFSLAYGTKLLLHNAHMRLVRGRRYGLLGRNGAGKSTLMRSIANGKVENFPGREQGVRSVFVEHSIQGEEGEKNVVDFVMDSFSADDVPPGRPDAFSKQNVINALLEVGFDEERQAMHVGALSGGWKMKLELARAILFKADLLLLDEPTNHCECFTVVHVAGSQLWT